MKKVLTYIFSLVAVLMLTPLAKAQTAENLVLKKTVEQTPDENGVRWITLESYVTGVVSVTYDSKPADIILVLDVSTSMTQNSYGSYSDRLEALRASALDFIEVINKNDQYVDWEEENPTQKRTIDGVETRLGNRIAIIPFGGSLNSSGNLAPLGLTELSSYTTLTNKVNGLTSTIRGTNPAVGLERAKTYLEAAVNAEKSGTREESNKTVVLFTDGCPARRGSTTFDAEYAYNAVNAAHDIKTSETYGKATVYTIGLFTDLGTNATQVNRYMNYASSNYVSASATSISTETSPESVTYDAGQGTWNDKYYQMAGDDNLNDIFKAIAHDSGGDTGGLTEEALVDVDIISNSFSLPSGSLASSYKPKVYVAQCTGYGEDGKARDTDFGTPIEVTGFDATTPAANFADVDNTTYNTTSKTTTSDHTAYNETITLTINGNEIETTGFNFGKNFCGRRYYDSETYGSDHPYADGYKLIVKIPIEVNEDAVGGAGTNTNEPGSGIYVHDDSAPDGRRNIAYFPQPTVTLPVNIWIKKYGLNKGESAKFTIQRIEVGKDVTVDNNWEDYTTVLITGTGETETQVGGDVLVSPIAKLNGLSSDYHYRVIEADDNHKTWSWSYTTAARGGIINSYDLEKNPFVFTNTKTEASKAIHHAESKAINIFGVGKSATTIDSREFLKSSGVTGTGNGN